MYLLNNRRKWFSRRRPEGASIPVSECEIEVETPVRYTGISVYPAVKVVYEGETLVRDVDYALTYKDNVNLGNGTVTVTGIGSFTGWVVKTFAVKDMGGGGTGSWDFDIARTILAGVKDMSSLTSDFRSITPMPVKIDGKEVVACSHGSGYYNSLLMWDGDDASSFEYNLGRPGREHGFFSHDMKRFSAFVGDNSSVCYLHDFAEPTYDIGEIDDALISAQYRQINGLGSGWGSEFWGFADNGMVFYRTRSYGPSYSVAVARMTTPYMLETISEYTQKALPANDTGFRFSPDGKNAIQRLGGEYGGELVKYSLETPFDVSTAMEDGRFDIGTKNAKLFFVNSAATKLVTVGVEVNSSKYLRVYDLHS